MYQLFLVVTDRTTSGERYSCLMWYSSLEVSTVSKNKFSLLIASIFSETVV
jgi:hypothetical protein